MVTVGATASSVTVAVVLAVQPFCGLVTVTVYTPGLLTTMLSFVLPVFHWYVNPPPCVWATRVAVGLAQVRVLEATDTVGGVVFPVTCTVVLAVQPLAGLAIATV